MREGGLKNLNLADVRVVCSKPDLWANVCHWLYFSDLRSGSNMLTSQCPKCQCRWHWKAAVRMPRPTRNRVVGVSLQRWPQSRPRTNPQLSDRHQPDIITVLSSWKSWDNNLFRSAQQSLHFQTKPGPWGGSVPLPPSWTPLCCVRCSSASTVPPNC